MRRCAWKNTTILLVQSRRKSTHLKETAKKLERPLSALRPGHPACKKPTPSELHVQLSAAWKRKPALGVQVYSDQGSQFISGDRANLGQDAGRCLDEDRDPQALRHVYQNHLVSISIANFVHVSLKHQITSSLLLCAKIN